MKIEIENKQGEQHIKFIPEDNYDAYQLGVIAGSGKLDVRSGFVASNPRSVEYICFTLEDLCNTLVRLREVKK